MRLTRRSVLGSLAALPAAHLLPGCPSSGVCTISWYAGPNEACFEHSFAPGDVVMRGTAQAGEHEIIVRNRLAQSVLTTEQQAVIFDLLLVRVNGQLVDIATRGGYLFTGGEEVEFVLMDFEFIVDVPSDDTEPLDQLALFDESVTLTGESPDRCDPTDLGYGLGFVVIRGGAVHEPGPAELTVDDCGMERFTPKPGDRLVYLDAERWLPVTA